MKLLLENWRQYLNEDIKIKGPEDFFYEIIKSPKKITINVLDMDKNPVDSKKKDTKSFISMEKRTDVPNWEVSWSSSPFNSKKVGTAMYLMALELVDEGLSPDSYETSPEARRVWDKFMKKNEFGVKKELKDGHEGEDETDPFNYVFFKAKKGILDKYNHEISEKEAEKPEKGGFDPENEKEETPYDPETFDWEELDYIDENLDKNDVDIVSKVIISDNNGQILLLKRSDDRNDWDLPGGHLKKGEKPEEGAHREVKEETNLDISDIKPLNTYKNTHFFKCKAPKGDISLQKDEHVDFKWVNPKEIDKFQIRNSLKDAILSAIGLFNEQTEPYQRYSRKTYKISINNLGKQGKNKYNVGGKMQKPSTDHLKSGPAGP